MTAEPYSKGLLALICLLLSPALGNEPGALERGRTPALSAARFSPEPVATTPAQLPSPTPLTARHAPLTGNVPPLPEESPEWTATTLDLWRRWLHLAEQQAYQQMPIINAALAERLHQGGGFEVYDAVGRLLKDDDLAFQVRAQLIDLLGEIATPEALALLLETAREGMDSPLYAPALNTISQIGDNHWGGRFHEELSPLLEQTWQSLGKRDWPLLLAVTRAIVAVGAPSGITLLIDSLGGGTPVTSRQSKDDERGKQIAVISETPKVTNPSAVPVLKEILDRGGSNPSTVASAGTGSPSVAPAVHPVVPTLSPTPHVPEVSVDSVTHAPVPTVEPAAVTPAPAAPPTAPLIITANEPPPATPNVPAITPQPAAPPAMTPKTPVTVPVTPSSGEQSPAVAPVSSTVAAVSPDVPTPRGSSTPKSRTPETAVNPVQPALVDIATEGLTNIGTDEALEIRNEWLAQQGEPNGSGQADGEVGTSAVDSLGDETVPSADGAGGIEIPKTLVPLNR